MRKYSNAFNYQFSLYLLLYRSGVIDFCGSKVEVAYATDGPDAKHVFMQFENGAYKNTGPISTKHPNVVKALITAKKGWGLWRDEWSSGIADGLFTKDEIIDDIYRHGVLLPESFHKELDTAIRKKKYA